MKILKFFSCCLLASLKSMCFEQISYLLLKFNNKIPKNFSKIPFKIQFYNRNIKFKTKKCVPSGGCRPLDPLRYAY